MPSIERLACMSDEQLRAVPCFVVGRSGVGEVAFLYLGRRCAAAAGVLPLLQTEMASECSHCSAATLLLLGQE